MKKIAICSSFGPGTSGRIKPDLAVNWFKVKESCRSISLSYQIWSCSSNKKWVKVIGGTCTEEPGSVNLSLVYNPPTAENSTTLSNEYTSNGKHEAPMECRLIGQHNSV